MNLRRIEHTRTGKLSDVTNPKWVDRTKEKIKELISTYKGKKFTTTNLTGLQREINSLLRAETGLRNMEVEAEVLSQGKIIFNYCNEATKSVLKRIYEEETPVGSADADMTDKLIRGEK